MLMHEIVMYQVYSAANLINHILKYPKYITLSNNNKDDIFRYLTPDNNLITTLSLDDDYQIPTHYLFDTTNNWRTNSTGNDSDDFVSMCTKVYSQQHIYENVQAKFVCFRHNSHIPHCSIVKLQQPALKFIEAGNAGGNSLLSEAYSIDLFTRYYGAKNIIYENDIEYWFNTCSIIDYIADINDQRVGVSVTRAINYQDTKNFTVHNAIKLLKKKLYGLLVARNAVISEQRYLHSILHIWAYNEQVANTIQEVCKTIDLHKMGPDVYGNVIIVISVCDNNAIYENHNVVFKYLLADL